MFQTLLIILALCSSVISQGADVLSTLDGDQIVTLMQTFGDAKCPPPPNNQSWAPIPESIACKDTPRCDFPKEWCSYKPAADGTPDLETLACQALNDECKQAFEQAAKDGSLVPPPKTTPGPEGGSPPPEGESSPPPGEPTPPPPEGASTPPMEGGSSPEPTPPPPEEGSSPPPMEPTPASGETPGSSPGPQGTGGTTVIPPFGECCDYHEYCCFWASLGQCVSNKLFMIQLCQSSCGTCGCSKTTMDDCNINVAAACANGNVTATDVCPCKSTDLINRDWHHSCSTWAANGGCEKNAQFMKPMCKKTCNVCP